MLHKIVGAKTMRKTRTRLFDKTEGGAAWPQDEEAGWSTLVGWGVN